jgi:predicted oxidoreductase (fatty acid repression mutant protein)
MGKAGQRIYVLTLVELGPLFATAPPAESNRTAARMTLESTFCQGVAWHHIKKLRLSPENSRHTPQRDTHFPRHALSLVSRPNSLLLPAAGGRIFEKKDKLSMTNTLIETIKKRRSQYALGKSLPISQDDATKLIQEAVKHTPSSFNSQSSRVLVLYGAESDKLWGFVKEALRKIVPADAFASTETRIDSFAAGAGTVLFFEDQDVVTGLQEKFALYADNFPIWSEQSSGMAQFSVWAALAESNIGASLQHYNPLADAEIAAEWNIPASWKLRAQMPFGANSAAFGEKTFMDDSDRFKVFG